MKRTVKNWTVSKLYSNRELISFPGYQREPRLWTTPKKQLLIDSILRDIDIPKLYFFNTGNGTYEVVDGQQRLWAIWDFLDDEFPITIGASGGPQKFSELDQDAQERITNYSLQISELEDVDEEYLRELFLRLQLGLLLITGEKLNAATGLMKDFVFLKLSKTEFIRAVGIPERRFARQTLCAQISINAFSRAKIGEFSRTRYEDLVHFFKEYERPTGNDLKFYELETGRLLNAIDEFGKHFSTQQAERLRNRSYILSIFLLFKEFMEDKTISSKAEMKNFSKFTQALWSRLREEIKAGIDRTNADLFEIEGMISSAPGEKYQITRRHEKLKRFYEYYISEGRILGDPG